MKSPHRYIYKWLYYVYINDSHGKFRHQGLQNKHVAVGKCKFLQNQARRIHPRFVRTVLDQAFYRSALSTPEMFQSCQDLNLFDEYER